MASLWLLPVAPAVIRIIKLHPAASGIVLVRRMKNRANTTADEGKIHPSQFPTRVPREVLSKRARNNGAEPEVSCRESLHILLGLTIRGRQAATAWCLDCKCQI